MKTLLALAVFVVCGCASAVESSVADTNVMVEHGKYGDAYYIKYKLTNHNFDLKNDGGGFSDEDGQFEIYLDRSQFPIASPNCERKLILRMPSTLSDDKNREQSIAQRKRLYDDIKSLREGKRESLSVNVKLDPYVKVKSKEPLVLQLEGCNVFFRTNKDDQYVE